MAELIKQQTGNLRQKEFIWACCSRGIEYIMGDRVGGMAAGRAGGWDRETRAHTLKDKHKVEPVNWTFVV